MKYVERHAVNARTARPGESREMLSSDAILIVAAIQLEAQGQPSARDSLLTDGDLESLKHEAAAESIAEELVEGVKSYISGPPKEAEMFFCEFSQWTRKSKSKGGEA